MFDESKIFSRNQLYAKHLFQAVTTESTCACTAPVPSVRTLRHRAAGVCVRKQRAAWHDGCGLGAAVAAGGATWVGRQRLLQHARVLLLLRV
jgi:hypothetical protein